MSNTAQDLREVGPWGQAVALTFRFLLGVVCLIAFGWLVSNFRQVPPDSQAVVMRFGTVARVQGPGLLLAWPRPIEQIVLLPAAARQLPLKVLRYASIVTGDVSLGYDVSPDPRNDTAFLLTGDSGVVHLEAQLFYQISDPVAYMIASEHVDAALQRLFIASAVSVVAGRDLDSILVARPEIASRADEAMRRDRLRADLQREVNRRLDALTRRGSGIGVTVSRVDLVPSIPAGAKQAFDSVLVVAQGAETGIANARTYGEVTIQDANRAKDRTATDATAAAEERVSGAKAQTASIAAIAQQSKDMSHSMQVTRAYFDRIGPLLKRIGRIDVVERGGSVKTYLPGATP